MNINKMNNENNVEKQKFFNEEKYTERIRNIFNRKQNILKVNPVNYNNFKIIGINIDNKLYEDKELKLYEKKFDFVKLKKAREYGLIGEKIEERSSVKLLLIINELDLDPEIIRALGYLKKIGLDITSYNIKKYIKKLNSQEIKFEKLLEQTFNFLKLGLLASIAPSNIKEFCDIKIDFDKLSKINNLKSIKMGTTRDDIKELNDIEIDFDKLSKLEELGVDLSNLTPYNLKELNDIEIDFDKLSKLEELGVDLSNLTPYNLRELNDIEIDFDKLSKLKELGVNLNKYYLKYFNKNETSYNRTLDLLLKKENDNVKNYYKGYNYSNEEINAHQYYLKSKIIEKIQALVQRVISEDREIGEAEIIDEIRQEILILPKDEIINFLTTITKIVEKFNTIHKYLDFKNGPYKTPKELLLGIRGIKIHDTIKNINNNITVKQHGLGLMFHVYGKKSFSIIKDGTHKKLDIKETTRGFNLKHSFINELEGTTSVIKGSEEQILAEIHEGKHNRNTYFMPDKNMKPLTRAKDEITAFLEMGDTINSIEETLTEKNSGYKYNLSGLSRNKHKINVKKLCKYANNLIKLTEEPNYILKRNYVIEMLSNTPADKRKDLNYTIMKAVKSSNNNQVWRTGETTIKSEIEEINRASSIDEVKYIINDPKYSSIRRNPNKSGREISAIIDEVITGNLPIGYVPQTIRPKIIEIIKSKNFIQ